MNKKKTILSALAAGLTLSTVLAACGGDDNEGASNNEAAAKVATSK